LISRFLFLFFVLSLSAFSQLPETEPEATTTFSETRAPSTSHMITITGMATTGEGDATLVAETVAETFRQAAAENPKVELKIANLGSRFADWITRKVMMKSKVPIQDLTPKERVALYFNTPEYRENFAFALIRGTANGIFSSITFVYSDYQLSALDLLPNAITVFAMSGGIQLGIDPFHAWLKNGAFSQALIPELAQKPEEPELQVEWTHKMERWRQREFYAKWFATQFTFMLGIDMALSNTGVFEGQSLVYVLSKTAINSLFAMFAEGSNEGIIVDATTAMAEKKSQGQTTESANKTRIRYDRVRRFLAGTLAVGSTALASFRNSGDESLWQALIPTDAQGAVLFGMGILGIATTKYMAWRKQKSCEAALAQEPLRH
jgi:hypothetical protein